MNDDATVNPTPETRASWTPDGEVKPPVPKVLLASPLVKQVWPNSAACWSPAAPAILISPPKCIGSAYS